MSEATISSQPMTRGHSHTRFGGWRHQRMVTLRRLGKDRTAVAGAIVLTLFVLVAIFAPIIAPHDPNDVNARARLASPSAEHWLGTDDLGRDILSRLIHGARWTLGTAFLAALGIVTIGVTVGLIAGYFGGIVDDILMRVVDVLLAFPSLVLALAIVGMLGPSLQNVMIGMVAVWWVDYARVMRGLTVAMREREFVTAAHCCGATPAHVIFRHLLPNVIPSVIVLATLEFGGLMLAISGLSFLGLGAQPPTPEWGTMLSDGRVFFQRAPELMLYPGLAISIAVAGCNLLGDGLRDALDPRMQRR
ncbi:MAG: nickel transporter permease [Thermomicrobiales bacterium]